MLAKDSLSSEEESLSKIVLRRSFLEVGSNEFNSLRTSSLTSAKTQQQHNIHNKLMSSERERATYRTRKSPIVKKELSRITILTDKFQYLNTKFTFVEVIAVVLLTNNSPEKWKNPFFDESHIRFVCNSQFEC
jgi:hypothetical protein